MCDCEWCLRRVRCGVRAHDDKRSTNWFAAKGFIVVAVAFILRDLLTTFLFTAHKHILIFIRFDYPFYSVAANGRLLRDARSITLGACYLNRMHSRFSTFGVFICLVLFQFTALFGSSLVRSLEHICDGNAFWICFVVVRVGPSCLQFCLCINCVNILCTFKLIHWVVGQGAFAFRIRQCQCLVRISIAIER